MAKQNTTDNPMAGMLEYPEEMDTISELDADDFGTLYSVYIGNLDMAVSVYVTDDGDEMYPSNWQREQPRTIEEMAGFDWYLGEDIDW